MSEMMWAAIGYAMAGWKVFPLSPNSKKPLPGTNGFLDATSDVSTVTRWFEEHPNANLGLATGSGSGVWALDVDTKHDGWASLDKLALTLGADHCGALLRTLTHGTTTDGCHLFYQWPEGDPLPRKINLFKHRGWTGLDLIGNDGYVVLPPSALGDKRYSVVNGMRAMPAPAALLGIIREALAGPVSVQGPRVTGQVMAPQAHGTAGVLAWLRTVQPGGQDDAIQWVARALKDEGLKPTEAADLLWDAVRDMTTDGRPWTENDVRRHIRSAFR